MANEGRDGKVAMVLSGGVALGVYQAGAYAALHEAEGLRPGWIAGSSIGAVNAAIIAGNPPESRIERLREFWDGAATAPAAPLWAEPPSEGPWRHAYNWMSTLQSRFMGRPGLFRPRLPPGGAGQASPSFYDLAPMRERLEALVDFDRLNGGDVRVSVVATDIATGEEVIFDTARGDRIAPEHLLATCGFIPEFPAVEIGGRVLGDGGLSANAPIDAVLLDGAEDLVCFVVDLFARDGGRAHSLEEGLARRRDLMFASQSRRSLKACAREWRLRALIGRLGARLPPGLQEDPEVAPILAEAGARTATVLHLRYRAPPEEAGPDRQFDFSRATLADRWRAGTLDMNEALRFLATLPEGAGEAAPGLTVHEVRR